MNIESLPTLNSIDIFSSLDNFKIMLDKGTAVVKYALCCVCDQNAMPVRCLMWCDVCPLLITQPDALVRRICSMDDWFGVTNWIKRWTIRWKKIFEHTMLCCDWECRRGEIYMKRLNTRNSSCTRWGRRRDSFGSMRSSKPNWKEQFFSSFTLRRDDKTIVTQTKWIS